MSDFRTFADSSGVRWTVLRVEPEVVSPTLERLRETLSSRQLERRRPWLLFESKTGERRRLAPVPDEWNQPGSEQLLADWCERAERVPPAPERRATDKGQP
jgi:hypothetical protein